MDYIIYGLGPGSSITIHGRMTISFDVDMDLPYPALVYMWDVHHQIHGVSPF